MFLMKATKSKKYGYLQPKSYLFVNSEKNYSIMRDTKCYGSKEIQTYFCAVRVIIVRLKNKSFKENIDCLMQRLISSQNPFLNEFNLIYKDIVQRLPIFESITEITDKEEQINNEEKVQSQNYEAYDQNYSAEVRNYSTFYEQQQNGYNPLSSQH